MPIIALTSDHAGVKLKQTLFTHLNQNYDHYEVIDLGPNDTDSVDYPDFGHELAGAITSGQADFGVAICGTGIGISMALNRHDGVRSALCHNGFTARMAKRHDNANVLALGARVIGVEIAKDCLDQFLSVEFEGGRHARRVAKITPTG